MPDKPDRGRATAPVRRIAGLLRRFAGDCRGGATVWSLAWMIAFLMLGGIAVDASNAWRVRAQLLATVDAAALGGAMQLPDLDAAAAVAVSLAEENMPPAMHGAVIRTADVEFGAWQGGAFVAAAAGEDPTAVRVIARRDHGRANAVPTFLLRMAGFGAWDVAVSAVAVRRAPGEDRACYNATIVTDGFMNVGGSSTLGGGVCLHGEAGVLAGGNGFYDAQTRISAAAIGTITINHPRAGSAGYDEVAVEDSRSLQIVPRLDAMFDALWRDIYDGPSSYYAGDLLPSFILDGVGQARIVRVNSGSWKVKPGELQPNTVYVVNHDMQFAGGVDAHNVAIIVNGTIGISGGQGLAFRDVFIFGADKVNVAGNIRWGDADTYCDEGRFNSYLFSKTALSLGGWGNQGGLYGVVAAAPDVSPGDALRDAGGIYIEAREHLVLGGNSTIGGCDAPLAGEFGLEAGETEQVATYGSLLVD